MNRSLSLFENVSFSIGLGTFASTVQTLKSCPQLKYLETRIRVKTLVFNFND